MDHTKQDFWQFWRIAFNNFPFWFYCRTHKKAWEANLLTYSLAEMSSRNSIMPCCHLVCIRYKPFMNSQGPLDEFVSILSRCGKAGPIRPFYVLRWHHIESLLDGGVTITVNFWYKVCKNDYPHQTCVQLKQLVIRQLGQQKQKSPTPSNTRVLLWISFH